MSVEIDDNGAVRWRDLDDAEHEWSSLAALAADWWRYQRLPDREKEADPMIAWECVEDFGGLDDDPHPLAMDVIQSLIEAAENDDELSAVGAGPLESLLSHGGHSTHFVDDVERRSRQEPRFRTALSGMWLGEDIPQAVRQRLATFGAVDLTDPRPQA